MSRNTKICRLEFCSSLISRSSLSRLHLFHRSILTLRRLDRVDMDKKMLQTRPGVLVEGGQWTGAHTEPSDPGHQLRSLSRAVYQQTLELDHRHLHADHAQPFNLQSGRIFLVLYRGLSKGFADDLHQVLIGCPFKASFQVDQQCLQLEAMSYRAIGRDNQDVKLHDLFLCPGSGCPHVMSEE